MFVILLCVLLVKTVFLIEMNSIIEIDKRMELPCIIEVNVVTLQLVTERLTLLALMQKVAQNFLIFTFYYGI